MSFEEGLPIMHEGNHGILDELKKKKQGQDDHKHDHKHDHNHGHGSQKGNTTAIRIFAGIIVVVAIAAVLLWKI